MKLIYPKPAEARPHHGRKPISQSRKNDIVRLYNADMTIAAIAESVGVSQRTVNNVIKERRAIANA